ncbi:hypothetical protein [Candidatus Pristimantibacillus sp. PTI5]|uniref:hypothetical protein n=1 Tax=Candidatus Pristimantibacillus sp. PTI5 TaxID=3400422 RepID=UPI003B018B80
MNKRNAWLLTAAFAALSLTACGTTEKSLPSNQAYASSTENGSASTNAEVFEVNSGETKGGNEGTLEDQVPNESAATNLLKESKVFKYDDSVVFTLETAEFSSIIEPSNPKDDSVGRKILSDSEIFLHIEGTLNNDTIDSVSLGHQLGLIQFFALYDGKHEFEGIGAVEEKDGSDFKTGSSVDSLTEGRVHGYFQVPKPVAESDKSLMLKVLVGEETFDIPLR